MRTQRQTVVVANDAEEGDVGEEAEKIRREVQI